MLAITMGGGKTKIATDLMQNWGARDVLIVSPLAACEDAWIPQLDQYIVGGYRLACSFSGPARRRVYAAENVLEESTDHRIVLVNHEFFWREPFRSFALDRQWDLVIADEIHREKSAGSKQSYFLSRLGLKASRRLGLTGTPMPHSPLDVYGQFRFLDRSIYGTNYATFENRYAIYGGFQHREVVGYKNLDDLNEKFYRIAIKVEDSEQGLPETVDTTHSVKMRPATRGVYEAMNREFIAEFGGGVVTAANPGVKLLRLHQIASGIVKLESGHVQRVGREKIEATLDVIGDLSDTEPVVVFTWFTPDTQELCDILRLRGIMASELSGRVNELADWKAGKTRILVAQIQAAKEGIDLTRAAVGIFHSTGIALGDYEQCRKRLHRPPQTRMVRFIHIVAQATRDVSTMRALLARQDVVKAALAER